MGSLASKPKVPTATTQVIYVPTATTTTTSTAATDTTDTSGVSDEAASEVRTQGLLSRDRSRFGTIATSLRGLLGLADNSGKRKTLLGE